MSTDDRLSQTQTLIMCTLEYDEVCTVVWNNCTQPFEHNRKYSGAAVCKGYNRNWTKQFSISLSKYANFNSLEKN